GAPELVAGISGAALTFRWGRQGDRRDQVLHLIERSEGPSVALRMIRFADGPASGPPGPVNVLDFPGDEPGMVFVETEFDVIEVTEPAAAERSEEHTSELQSRENLVCRLLLEKKNNVQSKIVTKRITTT